MARIAPSVEAAADGVRRELSAQARPPGAFDPSRYFRPSKPLQFLNVRTPVVRALARRVAREHRQAWTMDDALAFTARLLEDPHLEVKGAGIEALGVRRGELRPSHLSICKRWLAQNRAANWATTDTLCGTVIGPLLLAHPELVGDVVGWVAHRNLWVRRAAAVSLVRLAARGLALDDVYAVATALRPDGHDLIQKAAGWLLREAGRTDRARLERYLRGAGPGLSRTTLRYAIEHFPPAARRVLLAVTRAPGRRRTASPDR